MSTTDETCQNCDTPLAPDASGPICPACMVGDALDSLGTAAEADTTHLAPTGGSSLLPDPLEGTTLGIGGRYKILQKIGEGGFGTVYMAEQSSPVRRRVALKILKAGMDTRQLLARFEAERQALAMMDHPNIAKILDGGETEQGRPFFVMDLVRGTPITTHCDEEALPTQQRLDLFLKVCRAVQHAHQKGIIHRDLKPTNILVTVEEGAEPVPKVIDFGVAKAMENNLTDKTLFTRFEQMIGTPAYMSPEQAGAKASQDVDTRADIYALGVLLYELLTGTTPFEPKTLQSAAFDEVRRILREEEAPRPSARLGSMEIERRTTIARDRGTESSSLGKHLRGDLDWIVMKAIEKDRRLRYETANAIAADVERHLRNEPVSAGPPTVRYRFEKWRRRNARWIGIAAAAFTVMVVVTIYSSIQSSRASRAESQTATTLGTLQIAYDDLETAQNKASAAHESSQQLLVQTLLEKGTHEFNAGEFKGLIALQEAVTAAQGNEVLESRALELWTLANTWLPGEIHHVLDEPYAIALSHDESLLAWCDGTSLHLLNIATEAARSASLDPDLIEFEKKDNGTHLDYLGLHFSPNNQSIILHNPVAGRCQLWNVATLEPITGILRHPESRATVDTSTLRGWNMATFSHSGGRLVTQAADASVCLWDLERESLAAPSWQFGGGVSSAEFSSDDRLLYLGGTAPGPISEGFVAELHVIDLATPGFPRRSYPLEVDYGCWALRTTADSKAVTVGVRTALWDEEGNSKYAEEYYSFAEMLTMSPDGKTVAVGDRGGKARLYSSKNLDPVGAPLHHGGGGVRGIGFNQDGSILLTGGLDGTLQFWSLGAPTHRFGTWPQPGTIDQLVTSPRSQRFFLTKSRSRDDSQPACAQLRSFPKFASTKFDTLAEGEELVDLSADGETLLVRSADGRSLTIRERGGRVMAPGPSASGPEGAILFASFSPDSSRIGYGYHTSTEHGYRLWNCAQQRSELKFASEGSKYRQYCCLMLPQDPPRMILGRVSWSTDLVDFAAGTAVRVTGFANRTSCAALAEKLGWYAVGDLAGNVRRFRIDDHEELLPAFKTDSRCHAMAISGDNSWLMIVEREENGAHALRAWSLFDDFHRFSLTRPFLHDGTGLKGSGLFAVGERGFVYQQGRELRRIELPTVSAKATDIQALTRARLGIRKDESGVLRLLTGSEFIAARRSAASLQSPKK